MASYDIKLEPLCEVEAYVKAIPVGPSSWGIRVVAPVVEGTVEGPKIKGKLHPVGGDWGLIRADQCLELNVRALIETDDGAIIHTEYHGVADFGQEAVEAFLQRGEISEEVDLFVTPRFETSHETYRWLTRIQAVGRGSVEQEGDRFKVTYSLYALTAKIS